MNDSNKWIKLHSKMLNWEWYKNANTMRLFIHCLLKANWKTSKFEGVEVKRGSFVTSYQKLADELGISKQEIRTALKHLNSTQELTQSQHRKFTIISVINYELYQQANTMSNTELTFNQHSTNTELTTIVEYKNNRIIDDIDISSSGSNACASESLFEFIEKAFGRTFSSFEYERIRTWEDDDLTRYAIEITMLRGKTDLSFVEGVLRKFKANNITNLVQAKKFEEEYQARKNKKENNSRGKEESYIQRRLRELKEGINDTK